MSEYVWETFDSLFRTVHRQDQRVVELERRVAELERRLTERESPNHKPDAPASIHSIERLFTNRQADELIDEFPAERAA